MITEEGRMTINLTKTVKDILFPVFCFGCGEEGIVLCDRCFLHVSFGGQWFCPTCHARRGRGEVCGLCRSVSFLDAHVAVLEYREDALIATLIHEWKYNYVEETTFPLQEIVKQFINKHQEYFASVDAIVPVPLHKRRYAERGFNQAERIAAWVSKEIDRPYTEDSVTRQRYTPHQAKKTRDERLVNVVDAFWCNDSLAGKNVLLVDDVFTTGTTMQECAKALKQAGVCSVKGMTIARG